MLEDGVEKENKSGVLQLVHQEEDSEAVYLKMDFERNDFGAVPRLTADNYARWLTDIEDYLRSKTLWSVVIGKVEAVEEPTDWTDEKLVKAWHEYDSRDSKARNILRRTLDASEYGHVRDCKTAKEILDRIKEIKEPKTADAQMAALDEFFTLRWMDSDDCSGFMSNLAVISSKANANALKTTHISDDLMVVKLLGTLPDRFQTFVQAWKLTSKDKKYADLREALLAAERNLKSSEEARGEALAVCHGNAKQGSKVFKHATKDGQSSGMKSSKLTCWNCGGQGHTRRQCPSPRQHGGETSRKGNDHERGSDDEDSSEDDYDDRKADSDHQLRASVLTEADCL